MKFTKKCEKKKNINKAKRGRNISGEILCSIFLYCVFCFAILRNSQWKTRKNPKKWHQWKNFWFMSRKYPTTLRHYVWRSTLHVSILKTNLKFFYLRQSVWWEDFRWSLKLESVLLFFVEKQKKVNFSIDFKILERLAIRVFSDTVDLDIEK